MLLILRLTFLEPFAGGEEKRRRKEGKYLEMENNCFVEEKENIWRRKKSEEKENICRRQVLFLRGVEKSFKGKLN